MTADAAAPSAGAARRVGARVAVGGDLGTVRYVGEVEGQTGEWLGIEWDDPSRGKHSGATGGRQYFECAVRGAGSFVRAAKVPPGQEFFQALYKRYVADDDQGPAPDELFAKTARGDAKAIQLVGAEKIMKQQGQLEMLCLVALGDANIDKVGSTDANMRKLTEVHLPGNPLTGWEPVAALCKALPALQALDLSRTRLGVPAPALALDLQKLRTLVLNACNLTWPEVEAVAAAVPLLQELHLCSNSLTSLEGPARGAGALAAFDKLKRLVLDRNPLHDWAEVARLGTLPSLEHLQLNDTALTHVGRAEGDAAFPALRALLVGNTKVSEWGSVDNLNTFPSLVETRLSGTPLLAAARGGGRYEVIARVARLVTLNGSAVRASERRDSEIRYLRAVAMEAAGHAGDAPEAGVLAAHPRYKELVGVYGEVAGIGEGESGGGSAAPERGVGLVDLVLTSVAAGKGAVMGSKPMKLPAGTSLGQLKFLVEKLFKIPVARCALFLKSPGAPMPEDLSWGDDATIGWAGATPGCEILADDVDPEERKRRRAAEAAEAAQRRAQLEEQQLGFGDGLRAAERANLGI
ncbi:unnamed protein product [Pedinophyceae sp. YPF-701]|nr:unnamed protein product [Pedinophyceae sp. YPF-701]